MKQYTIKDIAQMAQVSRGTVDRVLHNRGKISKKARDRVIKVLKEIQYRPNLIARSLKSKRSLRVVTLIPNYSDDPYWYQCVIGLKKAQEEYAPFGLFVESFFYDPHNKKDFCLLAGRVLKNPPQGILLAPIFHKESLNVVARCNDLNVPCATINTLIEGDVQKAFVGQDLYQSGRVAAHLFQNLLRSDGGILITNIDEEVDNSRHVQDKERGFRSYFEGMNGLAREIDSIQIAQNQLEEMDTILTDYFRMRDNISGIFVTTSKTHLVAAIIRKYKLPLSLIGYDLIEDNLQFLKTGEIDFLINQNPYQQGYKGICILAEHLVFNKALPQKKMLPIDIVSPENATFYKQKKTSGSLSLAT